MKNSAVLFLFFILCFAGSVCAQGPKKGTTYELIIPDVVETSINIANADDNYLIFSTKVKKHSGWQTYFYRGTWEMHQDTLVLTPEDYYRVGNKERLICDQTLPHSKKPGACHDIEFVYKDEQIWFINLFTRELKPDSLKLKQD